MKFKLKFLQSVILSLFLMPAILMAQNTGEVLQKQFGKQTVTVGENQELTFYDFMGSEPIKGDINNNVQSLTVFKPASEGYKIQITFEQFDVQSHSEQCPHYLNLYDGESDADNSFVWASGPFDITLENCSLPSGERVRMEGNYKNYVFTSSSADGQLSVGHMCRMGKTSEGWKARVRCVPSGNMQIISAGTTGEGINEVPPCKYDVPFISFYIDAEGTDNADIVKSFTFKAVENEDAADVMQFAVYHGTASDFDIFHKTDAVISNIGGGEYEVTVSEPLQSGHNVFTLVGSFKDESTVNSRLTLEGINVCTEKHPSGFTPFNNAGKITVLVPPVEYMHEGHTKIGIGDTPITFYDNGGPGKMSPISEGITTFVPEKKGFKVKIDFQEVNLHKTEYSDKSEEIRIYNGSNVDERYLVKVLTETQTAVVHSTADDGALTIVYRDNDAGSYYKQDGFKAVVSTFSPSGMELRSAAAETLEGTVCGGLKEAEIMKIVLHTENTEPALKVQNFNFVTNGTFKAVDAATLYYCGREVDMEQALEIGTVRVKGDSFSISADKDICMVEGDNIFMLVYDVNPEAKDGFELSAAVTDVTLSGNKYEVANETDKKIIVNNIVYSEEGRREVVVSGRKTFKSRLHSSGETYMPGTTEQIITFTPAHDGNKMQIDFNSFKLYYSSQSYDVHCTFEVYSGRFINEATLLWKLGSAEEAEQGPSQIIRSSSDDGVITVVFNPNTTSTAGCSRGFDADVFEYTEQPMELEDVLVKQITNDKVKAGDKNVQILDVNVRTMGSADDYTFDAITLDLKGSEKEISRVAVYDRYAEGMLSEKTVTPSDKTVVLKFTEEILKDGDNHYLVCFDVNDNASESAVLDASVSSVTLSGVETKVTEGDPEGFIRLRNIYNISGGEAVEKIISADTPLSFYDAGGFDGTCGSNFNGTVTFAPADKNDVIKLVFKSWNVAYGDVMRIYSGGVVTDTPDYMFEMKDKNLPGSEIISKSADGKITVNFVTTYNDSEGFEIEVLSCKREDIKITEVSAESVYDESLFRGSEDVPVMKIKVRTEGNSNAFDITSFKFDNISEGTISALHVYATGKDSAMYRLHQFGSGLKDITGTYNISEPGEYNFFVTADIKNSSSVGDEVSVNISLVNDSKADNRFYTVVRKGISGTVTIGKDKDFASIEEALDAVKEGIEGNVTINIDPGVYTVENLNIPHISGSSSKNTVTITSSTRNYHDVRIFGYNFNQPLEYEDYYGVVTFDGSDYVTLKNIEITTDDKQYPSVVRIKNNSCHITIDSCYIHAETVTGYKDKIMLVETYSKLEEGQNTDYVTVSNCILEGARIGLRFAGASSVYLSDQRGNRIVNNILRNQGMIGIYGVDISDIEITGNTITNDKTDAAEFKAVDLNIDSADGDVNISGNTINVSAPTKQTVFLMRNMKALADKPARIFNNQISCVGGTKLSHALVLGGDEMSNVEFAYNTFMINGKDASSLIYVKDADYDNVSFVNNILANGQNDAVVEMEVEPNGNIRFGYNVFSSESNDIANVAGAYRSYDDFVVSTGAENCYKDNVIFFSDDVLAPMEQGVLANAKALDYVMYDITGTKRSETNPTIGAYEYEASLLAPQMKYGYPKVMNVTSSSADVVVNSDMSGKAYVIAMNDNAEIPGADKIVSEGKMQNIVRNADNVITVKNLNKGDIYRIYVLVESIHGIRGSIYKTDSFVAEGDENETPEKLVVKSSDVKAAAGEEVVLKASVSGGKLPYDIEWRDNMNVVVKKETLSTEGETKVSVVSDECNDYVLSVTDAAGTVVRHKVRLITMGEAVTATFENLYLGEESYWNGSDMNGSFVSGSYKFTNSYEPDWMSWGGFSYSNVTDTEFTSYLDNTGFANAVGCGYDGSDNYAVVNCFVPAYVDVLNKNEGDSIRGFYITNAACVYKSVTKGDGMSEQFKKGDYLMLTISDVLTDNKVEYYLADYRSENEADHYCLDSWQWLDLRNLGSVRNLKFSISGSQNNDYGLLTPGYFCMDNFNGHRVITEVPAQIINDGESESSIDLSQFFKFDNNAASVVYSVDEIMTEGEFDVSVSGSELIVRGTEDGDFTVIVKAVQKGKIQFVSIPVTFTKSISNVDADEFENVKYRYSIDGKRINTNSRQQGINIIRDNNGEVKKVVVK